MHDTLVALRLVVVRWANAGDAWESTAPLVPPTHLCTTYHTSCAGAEASVLLAIPLLGKHLPASVGFAVVTQPACICDFSDLGPRRCLFSTGRRLDVQRPGRDPF